MKSSPPQQNAVVEGWTADFLVLRQAIYHWAILQPYWYCYTTIIIKILHKNLQKLTATFDWTIAIIIIVIIYRGCQDGAFGKGGGLSITMLTDWVTAVSDWQAFNLKLLGLLNWDLNFEASWYRRHVKIPPLLFAHWESIEAEWCCQSGRVVLWIPSDYTDSSRNGKYWKWSQL